jgi:hypothetical protein
MSKVGIYYPFSSTQGEAFINSVDWTNDIVSMLSFQNYASLSETIFGIDFTKDIDLS